MPRGGICGVLPISFLWEAMGCARQAQRVRGLLVIGINVEVELIERIPVVFITVGFIQGNPVEFLPVGFIPKPHAER